MKRTVPIIGALICITTLLVSLAFAANPLQSKSGWFDFENCAFCKNLSAEAGLLEHSTWESHPIKNGLMNIITVEPDYAEAMARAGQNMADLGLKIQAGEVNPMGLQMCQHCQTFGMLMMGGVNMEEVRGDAAVVTLMTSDDAGVVTRLQELAKRDTDEMALMSGAEHPHK